MLVSSFACVSGFVEPEVMSKAVSLSVLRCIGLALFAIVTLFPLYWVLKIAVTPTALLYT